MAANTMRVLWSGIIVVAVGVAACEVPARPPRPNPQGFGIAGAGPLVGDPEPFPSGVAGTGGGSFTCGADGTPLGGGGLTPTGVATLVTLHASVTQAAKPVPAGARGLS